MTTMAERYTGASIKRSEDPRILTGQGRYIDDVRLPGMLHASFVRSPFAHARIISIDVEEARQAPGVVLVLTGAELQEKIVGGPGVAALFSGGAPVAAFTTLATDKVRLVGDPVAIVVAETRYQAEDACELIYVDYDELPPVMTREAALDSSLPAIFEDLGGNVLVRSPAQIFGDVDGAFARADRVVRAELRQHRHQNVPMECRGVVCSWDPDGEELTVHSANQGVHIVAMVLAGALGMEQSKV
jgi:carbon-monoxide dehydrogenase large subunit